MTQYSKEELENKINNLYPLSEYKIMTTALIEAFRYLPKQDVDKLLNYIVIFIQGNISRCLNRDDKPGTSVIIISIEDLKKEKYFIPIILHEAAHEILGHKSTTGKAYIKQEDEAWNKVRNWLPKEFNELINDLEIEGGGTKGGIIANDN